uniref:Pheromone phb3.2 n=1 Tax=Pleurotus eryngii var. eryngii TaxID=280321 RepID=X2DEZ1_PLEER|nr:pheromone phb3.2 [Pleurotus eryngii var. eryngii]
MDTFYTITAITDALEQCIAPVLSSIPIQNNSDDDPPLPVPVDEERYGGGVTSSWCTIS